MKTTYPSLLIIFCFVTMAIFLGYSHLYDSKFYKTMYYPWVKIMELFLIGGYIFFTRGLLRIAFIIGTIFFLIRVIWQVFELENYVLANQPKVIDILFVLCIFTILVISLLPLIIKYAKSHKDGRI